MKKYTAAQFYLDGLAIQAAFGDDFLVKQAEGGFVDELIAAVKSYVGDRYNPEDKVGSLINILAPGAMTVMFSALGLPWVGAAVGLAMDYFKVDIGSIFKSIYDSIVEAVKTHGVLSSEFVANTVEAAFKPELSKASCTTKEALLYKFALKEYSINKNAGVLYNIVKGKTITLLSKVVKWIFFTVLASIGIIGVSDTIGALVGGPAKTESSEQQSQVVTHSKQTKFNAKPSGSNALNSSSSTWIESNSPTTYNIISMVLDWMSDAYDGVEQYENLATKTIGFNKVVEEIKDYNKRNTGGRYTYIPRMFPSKKSAVDMFIDDVANQTPSLPKPNSPPSPLPSPIGKPPTTYTA